jgi:CubicO group peptidase (beta-lactamase class C family)
LNTDYWPTKKWQSADPETVGVLAELSSKLDREVKARFRDINAVLIVRNGHLIFENYYGGFGPDDIHLVASVTKSFISALVGIAISRGFIEGVEQRVLDFFPEFVPGTHEHLKQQMTIKHLLTMTTGFQWRTGARSHELSIDRLRRSKDWVAFILDLPVRERSFGTFQYNSAVSHLLSAIITRSTGMCAAEFATEHLFNPIGINLPTPHVQHGFSQTEVFRNESGGWPRDPQGNSIGGWGLNLTPRDMARFGYLYLKEGQWDGQDIIPKKWVADSLLAHTPGYGYQWWLRSLDGLFVFSAVGQGGNHIFGIPEKDLIVVVASTPGNRWRDRWELLDEIVIPAVIK